MAKIKISKEEKAFIKAYVKFIVTKYTIKPTVEKLASELEYEVTGLIDNRNCEYRDLVEEFIKELLYKI